MKRPWTRRAFTKTVAAAGTTAGLAPHFAFPQGEAKKKPNVLFIAIDDLNDWVGCLGGHPDVKTPNLDRMARRGVNFTRAYCAAPACNPSRVALMTGIRPSTSGVYLNPQPFRPVMPKAVTLQQHFMAHGYRVTGGGKIFHGLFPDPDSWHEYLPKGQDKKEPEDFVNLGGVRFGAIDGDDDVMDDHRIVDWGIKQLAKPPQDDPFFLAVGIYKPHLPWNAPKKYFDMYPPDKITLPNVKENDLDDVPAAGKRMAKPTGDHRKVTEAGMWRRAVQAYLACVTFTDGQVGRLLDALDRSAHRDNTIVVLWSDHGWHLGEKLHWRKFALWEEATHNVLMISAPGVTRPAQRCARPVSLIDIYPTLNDLCDLAPRKELEGESLMTLLKDPTAPRKRPALTTHGRGHHSLRSERWRYIRYADGSEELYDHDRDEMEWSNLADDRRFAPVKKRLAQWLPTVNTPDAPTAKEGKKSKKSAVKKSKKKS